ncbi:MAG: DNA polymerase III subunit alpha [Actinobacteria bacterium]|nr:DNA polymerase III subunit alpha [Actinomycetota bacterium]
MTKSRVELHLHTHYSLMDGLNTAEEYVEVAKAQGMPAISITDHGTLSGHREMQIAAKAGGLKPILGVEAYISPTDRFDRRAVAKRDDNTQLFNHILLLAKDEAGLKNLHAMSREAWQSGFYSKPRMDWELLRDHGDGIIVLSGCMNGLIPKAFARGDQKEALRLARQYKERFGDDFYLEVQSHNPPELNNALWDLSRHTGIKAVATTDCHFTRPELRWVEESMLILSTSPKRVHVEDYDKTKHIKNIFDRFRTMYPERPISFEEIDVYLMTREEQERGFEANGADPQSVAASIDTTFEIADKIGDYEFLQNEDFLPRQSDSPDRELRDAVFLGLAAAGLDKDPEYVARANEELAMLEAKKFAPYFLIVADMVRWAREQDILVGPGRGSAASSLVCYATGITRVDPIKYKLLFFRFIDASREDWPDIDVDFERNRRGEVKEYLRKKYGYVASISNFIYFKDKQVIRDAAKVFGVPINEVNKALKQVEKWDDFMTTNHDATVNFRNNYPEVIELAEHLRGRIRSVGMHAAGVVTSSVPLEEYAPFETRSDPDEKVTGRVPVVAWDMKQCADVGLIKLDLLGLKTLDIIHDTLRLIQERHGKMVDIENLPLDDQKVYKGFQKGHTQGIFQADGATNRNFLMKIVPTDFEDLVAATSLARPGAMNTVGDVFLDRKHGREKVTYVHEIMEPVLRDTYGTIVYQEQVMLAATELGGMTKSESNNLRSIIGKKKDASEFAQYKDRFFEGALEHITKEQADKLWHDFEAHAGYSFNRSHAVAYSLLTYWSMWLKVNYPLEFMTAQYRYELDKDKRVDVLLEMRRLKLSLKLPRIGKSGKQAQIEGESIRLGLTDIKYVSDKVYRKLEKLPELRDMQHLQEIAAEKGSGVNTRVVSALSRAGAVPGLQADPDSLYEYLRIPKFRGQELPVHVLEQITDLVDFDEDGTHIIKALVVGFKRGKTKAGKEWVQVTVLDETGRIGVFCDPDDTPDEGQMYIFLMTSNRIYEAIPIDEFKPNVSTPFVDFVYNGKSRAGVGEVEVLSVEHRFTAKRQMMATFVAANDKGEMRRVLVFPKTYSKYVGKLKPGRVSRVKMKELEDKSMMLMEMT